MLYAMAVTLDTIVDTLLDNADFEEDDSLAKARSFATAAKQFLILSPQSQSNQGSSMTLSVAQIENLLRRAQQFIDQKVAESDNSGVRFLTIAEDFRR